MLAEGVLTRPDGRAVAWATWGVEGGRPLLDFHGTPGCRLIRSSEAYARAGAHLLTFDRPGYGRSTMHADRTMLSVADDAVALAEALGWDRFAVLGVSGGGPHALATAFRAPERVSAVGLVGSGAPVEMEDPDDLIAFNREARRRVIEEGRASLEEFLRAAAEEFPEDPAAALEAAMEDAPESDREVLARPEFREHAARSLRESFAQGPQGWLDDAWAQLGPWGFDLRDVPAPVRMWFGELDRNAPPRSIERMAAELNVASLEIFPGAGHLGWILHEERMLRELLY